MGRRNTTRRGPEWASTSNAASTPTTRQPQWGVGAQGVREVLGEGSGHVGEVAWGRSARLRSPRRPPPPLARDQHIREGRLISPHPSRQRLQGLEVSPEPLEVVASRDQRLHAEETGRGAGVALLSNRGGREGAVKGAALVQAQRRLSLPTQPVGLLHVDLRACLHRRDQGAVPLARPGQGDAHVLLLDAHLRGPAPHIGTGATTGREPGALHGAAQISEVGDMETRL